MNIDEHPTVITLNTRGIGICKDGHKLTHNATRHWDGIFDPTTTNPRGALRSALCCPAVRTALAGTFSTSTSSFTESIIPAASGVCA